MAIALVGVSLLVLFLLGWRESVVVAVAIPSTLSLMLLVFFLLGYTLNRITLFAMIFSIGILVDDAIVVVENIVRHRDLQGSQRRSLRDIAVEAVAEVGNPTVLATLTVIAAILPMAFVGGLSGPYLRPIPVGASVAMVFSLLVAFVVTPWAAVRLLRLRGQGHAPREGREDRATRAYRWLMSRLVGRSLWRWSFLGDRPPLRSDGLRSRRVGAGQDAALRQQERAGGRPQHARDARWNALRRPAIAAASARRRGHRLSGLRRDGGSYS
jgi:multidrug efflux pump subunit AcrB